MILTAEKKTDRLKDLKTMVEADILDWKTARNIRSEEYSRGKKGRSAKVIKWVNAHKQVLLAQAN